MKKGEAEASPFLESANEALVALVLAVVMRTSKGWGIQLDGQVTLRQFLRTNVADEGEAVAVLEVGLSDDITLEPGSRRDTEVATIAQSEYHLLTAGQSGRDGL